SKGWARLPDRDDGRDDALEESVPFDFRWAPIDFRTASERPRTMARRDHAGAAFAKRGRGFEIEMMDATLRGIPIDFGTASRAPTREPNATHTGHDDAMNCFTSAPRN